MVSTAQAFTIDVKVWNLDVSSDEVERLRAFLSPAEVQRASEFFFPNLTKRYIVAHGRVRESLALYVDRHPEKLVFVTDGFGKPKLADAAGPYFNLSHSEDLAALAITPRAEIGIDIERVQSYDSDLAAYALSPAEQCALAALPDALQAEGFFRCWTRKEALLKAMGEGLSIPLHSFDVSLSPHDPARLLRFEGMPDEELASWRLLPFEPAYGVAGAVALRSSDQSPSMAIERLL